MHGEVDFVVKGPSGGEGLDRRGRKKAATRDSIVEAAQGLFARCGYESVTVLDIAEAADVGTRTFYNHFSGKEDVAIDHLRRFVTDGLQAFEARPADEHLVSSIRAVLEAMALGDYDEGLAIEVWLVDTVTEVAGVQHHLMVAAQDRLTAIFAGRLGSSPCDHVPRIYALATTMAIEVGVQTWLCRQRDGIESSTVWELGRDTIDALAGGLGGDMGAPV